MAKISISKDQLEGLKNPPAGIYDVRLDGFKPKAAKAKPGKDPSTNLRPQLKIINHSSLNDAPVFTHCNTAFGVEIFDMCHAFGVKYEGEGVVDDPQMPGEFQGPDDNPDQWTYIGPLVGQVAKVEVAETTGMNGQPTTQVKRWICRVPGCTAAHRDNLISK